MALTNEPLRISSHFHNIPGSMDYQVAQIRDKFAVCTLFTRVSQTYRFSVAYSALAMVSETCCGALEIVGSTTTTYSKRLHHTHAESEITNHPMLPCLLHRQVMPCKELRVNVGVCKVDIRKQGKALTRNYNNQQIIAAACVIQFLLTMLVKMFRFYSSILITNTTLPIPWHNLAIFSTLPWHFFLKITAGNTGSNNVHEWLASHYS